MTASTRPPTHRDPWGRVVALGITQITSWGSMHDLFALLMQPLQRELQIDKTWIVGAFSGALLLLAIRWQHHGAH